MPKCYKVFFLLKTSKRKSTLKSIQFETCPYTASTMHSQSVIRQADFIIQLQAGERMSHAYFAGFPGGRIVES